MRDQLIGADADRTVVSQFFLDGRAIGRLVFPDVGSWLAFTTALGVGADCNELRHMLNVEAPDAPELIRMDERIEEGGP